MTRLKFGIIVAFLSSVAVSGGCSGAPVPSNNTAKNEAGRSLANSQRAGNDSAEELQALIPITFEPEEVTWRASESGGKQRLVAILLLTSDARRTLAARYASPPTDVQVNVDQWFPVELITMGETSGEMTVAGKAFPANDFYQAPYTAGNIVFIPDTNYVILDLQSN